MDTLKLNPDRIEKLDLARRKPKHILAHWNRRRVEEDEGCSCNGTEVTACHYCRRKLAKEELPW